MAVELILMENVDDLGRIGDVVKVADGYARNYLVPRKLAAKATQGALRQLEARKKQIEEERQQMVRSAQEVAAMLQKASVTIPVQAGDDEKLYGSVGNKQIADALAEMNIHIDRRKIALVEPIRELGVYTIDVLLHEDVSSSIKVWVVRA